MLGAVVMWLFSCEGGGWVLGPLGPLSAAGRGLVLSRRSVALLAAAGLYVGGRGRANCEVSLHLMFQEGSRRV